MNYFLNSTVNQLLWINFIRTCQVEMNGSKPQVFFFSKNLFYFIPLFHKIIWTTVSLWTAETSRCNFDFLFCLSQAKRNKAQKPVIKSVPETHYADPTVASKLKVSTPYYQGTVLERSFSAPPSPRYIFIHTILILMV